jgi:DNA polymerase-3 subunit chi
MTRVEFIFNVADKLAKITDLSEKAVAKGRQLTILSTDETLKVKIGQQLWQHSPTSFLPNATATDDYAAFSPIQIHMADNTLMQDDVLINMHAEVPIFFGRFRYLVELVGNEEADKVAARARFKFYRDRGYEIKSTNMANNSL